jgi:hypothetical protein
LAIIPEVFISAIMLSEWLTGSWSHASTECIESSRADAASHAAVSR